MMERLHHSEKTQQDLASDGCEGQRKGSLQNQVGFRAEWLKLLEKDSDGQRLERKYEEFSLGHTT